MRGERVASRSVTASPETLAAFLLVAAVLVLPFAIRSRKRFYKVIYSAAFVLSILAILATECIPVLFAAVVILLVYLIRRNRRIPAEIALIVSFLPCLVLFLPNSLLDAVSRALSTSLSLSEIKQALISGFSLFSENVFAGAGAEELSSIGGAVPHIILGIGYRFGIFALLAFLLFLFARFRQLSVFTSYLSSSSLKDLVELSAVAVLSVLAFGSFHDVLLDPSIFYLFFIVFAVYAAALRISRFDYEDLLAYYGDQRSHHSSVIDVAIRA